MFILPYVIRLCWQRRCRLFEVPRRLANYDLGNFYKLSWGAFGGSPLSLLWFLRIVFAKMMDAQNNAVCIPTIFFLRTKQQRKTFVFSWFVFEFNLGNFGVFAGDSRRGVGGAERTSNFNKQLTIIARSFSSTIKRFFIEAKFNSFEPLFSTVRGGRGRGERRRKARTVISRKSTYNFLLAGQT